MEFLLINHPLDCPICDQAGECKLQDYSYEYGSGDSRMAETKRRYRYEDLGGKIVIDKNRCIHCTRCVRFTQEVSGTWELTTAQRGSKLEVTTYSGKTMDQNPWAGNVVDLCPVGALTSRDFRFNKRVWYLKSIPTISRLSALANPLWADVDQNKVFRFRPRPQEGKLATHFITDEERYAYHEFTADPATRAVKPRMKDADANLDAVRDALHGAGRIAVVGQGAFGCDAAQRLGELASFDSLRFGSGDRMVPIQLPKFQTSADGVFNRRGFSERGYRFSRLDELEQAVKAGEVKAVVFLHDAEFSSQKETERLLEIARAAAFSLALEVAPSALGEACTAFVPVANTLEESDFAINHDGELRRWQKALEPPRGLKPAAAVAKALAAVAVPA
jgi:NADH-quinone oxidoreductase subunit G